MEEKTNFEAAYEQFKEANIDFATELMKKHSFFPFVLLGIGSKHFIKLFEKKNPMIVEVARQNKADFFIDGDESKGMSDKVRDPKLIHAVMIPVGFAFSVPEFLIDISMDQLRKFIDESINVLNKDAESITAVSMFSFVKEGSLKTFKHYNKNEINKIKMGQMSKEDLIKSIESKTPESVVENGLIIDIETVSFNETIMFEVQKDKNLSELNLGEVKVVDITPDAVKNRRVSEPNVGKLSGFLHKKSNSTFN